MFSISENPLFSRSIQDFTFDMLSILCCIETPLSSPRFLRLSISRPMADIAFCFSSSVENLAPANMSPTFAFWAVFNLLFNDIISFESGTCVRKSLSSIGIEFSCVFTEFTKLFMFLTPLVRISTEAL